MTGDPVGLVVSGLVTVVGFAPASDVVFGIVFGVFVLALAILGVVAIRWGIRRDRPGRQAWRERQLEASSTEVANGRADPRARPGWRRDER